MNLICVFKWCNLPFYLCCQTALLQRIRFPFSRVCIAFSYCAEQNPSREAPEALLALNHLVFFRRNFTWAQQNLWLCCLVSPFCNVSVESEMNKFPLSYVRTLTIMKYRSARLVTFFGFHTLHLNDPKSPHRHNVPVIAFFYYGIFREFTLWRPT